MRPLPLLALLAALLPYASAAAPPLYEAQAIVTGQEAAERARGFALCLEDVLIKLSGDPTLAGDPRLAELKPRAGELVATYRYHDRMEGIPIHDEQGTRERPYDLTADFVPGKVDAALATLGRKPWTALRPTLTLFVGMKRGSGAFVLTADGERDFAPRLSLDEASARRGLAIRLPTAGALASARIDYDNLGLDSAARASGTDLPLVGHLVWSDARLSWQAQWEFTWDRREYRWQRPVDTFDAGFRSGLEGAAQILSGTGVPQ